MVISSSGGDGDVPKVECFPNILDESKITGTFKNIKPIGLFCKEVIYHIHKSGLRISFLEVPYYYKEAL